MNNFEIVFSRPWFLLLLIPVIAIIVLPFLRLPAKRRKNWKKIVPVILHVIVCSLLVLCLSGLSFLTATTEQSVMILMDLSDSTADSHQQIVTYANGIREQLDQDCGVLAFAGNCVYQVEISDRKSGATLTEVIAQDTDIAEALQYAASLLPIDTNRRIILLSDGKETSGDANATASALAKKGYRIDAVYFESTYLDSAEMQISEVALPEEVYAGDTIHILVTVESNAQGNADLVLYDGEKEIERTAVEVQKGSNSYSLTTDAETSGVHTYQVCIESKNDSLTVNNTMYSYVNVAGESGILVIADDVVKADALEAILDTACELTVVEAKNAPRTIIELCNYDEVILVNVDAKDLPDGFADLLSTYVSSFGRSVLTAGGKNTYMYGNMQGTALEKMMPVELMLNEDVGKSVAVMLVLDCSGSMSQSTNYLSMAKQSAIQSVNAMTEKDYVGVVSFNRYATLESPLLKATETNKAKLIHTISRLTTSQGTYYTGALEIAREELLASDADKKHIIFLSDGEPNDSGYTVPIFEMQEEGITVSTIALGYSSTVLSGMADLGGGRYYTVADATDLPDIMISETERVTVSSLMKGKFVPVVDTESALTKGLDPKQLPALHGYLGVTLKEEARSILMTEAGDPLYALWDYGLGTVASFMSDLEGEWSYEWLTTAIGKLLIERMVTTTVDDTHKDSSIRADFEKDGSTTDVTVECVMLDSNATVSIAVAMPNGESKEYPLQEIRPGVYRCEMDTAMEGIYRSMIVQYDEAGNAVDYLDTALAISYSAEYNAFAEAGDSLLAAICAHSDGMVTRNISKLAGVKMDAVEIRIDPLLAFAIICAILLFADFVIRLLRVKDIKEFIAKVRKAIKK